VDARYAENREHALLVGPSGTGKTTLAKVYAVRAFEAGALRRDAQFHSVNCASFSDPIHAHSTLFGHVRGAYSGAEHSREGLFQICSGGVLFLDEFADLPEHIQVMLMTAIDDGGTATRLGADPKRPGPENQPYRTSDVCVVAGTSEPLENMRDALVWRFTQPVELPPLDQRPDELRSTLRRFLVDKLDTLCNRPTWLPTRGTCEQLVDGDLLPALVPLALGRTWPGNFRELRRKAHDAIILPPDRSRDAYASGIITEFRFQLEGSRSILPGAPAVAPPPTPDTVAQRFVDELFGHVSNPTVNTRAGLEALVAGGSFIRADIDAVREGAGRASQELITRWKRTGLVRGGTGQPPRYTFRPTAPAALAPTDGDTDATLADETSELVAKIDEGPVAFVCADPEQRRAVGVQLARRSGDACRLAMLWSLEEHRALDSFDTLLGELEALFTTRGAKGLTGSTAGLRRPERIARLAGYFETFHAQPVLIIDNATPLMASSNLEESTFGVMIRCWSRCGLLLLTGAAPRSLACLSHYHWLPAAELMHDHYARFWAEANPHPTSFDDLKPELRASNLASVADIIRKLTAIGHALERLPPGAPPPATTITEDEYLTYAKLEHERWRAEKKTLGYTLGPRDEAAKKNPNLVDFAELDAGMRAFNVDAAKRVPALLERMGYALVRS
jgi:hypothetical protein